MTQDMVPDQAQDHKTSETGRKGLFIVIDGPDGCGKTTQLEMLKDYFERRVGSTDVHVARNPGTTELGEQIRELLKGDTPRSNTAEMLLCLAAIADMVAWATPLLEQEKVVLCDRFISSTIAYQGYAGGAPIRTVQAAAAIATEMVVPDLTIILSCPASVGLARRGKELDAIEKRGKEWHENVFKGFLAYASEMASLAKQFDVPCDTRVVVATTSPEEIHTHVKNQVEPTYQRWLERNQD